MLRPEYWIEQTSEVEELILNREEINKLNKKTFRQMKSKGLEEWLCDLEKYPKKITKEELLNTMKTYSSKEVFPIKPCYNRWGMLVKREDVRAFPTDTVFAEEPKGIDFVFFS